MKKLKISRNCLHKDVEPPSAGSEITSTGVEEEVTMLPTQREFAAGAHHPPERTPYIGSTERGTKSTFTLSSYRAEGAQRGTATYPRSHSQ